MEAIPIKQLEFTGRKNTVVFQAESMKTPLENNGQLARKNTERSNLAGKFRTKYKFSERAQQNSPRLFLSIR